MSKVLMLAPTPFFSDRGCHVRIFEEAAWLKRLGHDVRILTYDAGRDLKDLHIVRAPGLLPYRKIEAGPSLRKPLADFALLRKARQLIKNFQPEIVHCHLHEGAFLGMLVADQMPVLLDYQGSLASELSEHHWFFRLWPVSAGMGHLEETINARVRLILLNSGSLLAELPPALRKKCRVVGDGVDLERFKPSSPDPELQAKAGLKAGVPVIVYLGLLNRYQGIDLLLLAASLLKERGVRFQLLLLGYPLGEYPAAAEKMGIQDDVRFVGRIDYFQAQRWLSLGRVAVAPKISRTESNGKLLNFLAMGLPVVCFDREVDRELAGECAEYAVYDRASEEKSAASLADALEKLLADESRRQELSQRARNRALERFSWAEVAGRIANAYREIQG
jgi:glycosyltransferase involved in cell wall biosynthesis